MKIVLFFALVFVIVLSAAFIHWLILRQQCLWKHLVQAEHIEAVYMQHEFWAARFSPGKVLGLFPIRVYWKKPYIPGKRTKYLVVGNEKWIRNKIAESRQL